MWALAAYLNFEVFRDSGHFAAWVVQRAKWLALDRLRATGRLYPLLTFAHAEESSQELRTWLGEVMDALEQLPPAQREALKLSIEGYSTGEAAAQLGTTEATVRSLRRHARIKLLRKLSSVEEVR